MLRQDAVSFRVTPETLENAGDAAGCAQFSVSASCSLESLETVKVWRLRR